ncbi:hypothetical protein BDV98DRAFT_253002 [Pterulicium gracile]|uniref:Uncharacterized protein n=1 Tax=Pterulicium gracile TaxID=1884261 RepID=A0A5C3QH75_9AGAR|nr:hypothetical protein BDV98DRAFT_253002 [Pterula gracilis]
MSEYPLPRHTCADLFEYRLLLAQAVSAAHLMGETMKSLGAFKQAEGNITVDQRYLMMRAHGLTQLAQRFAVFWCLSTRLLQATITRPSSSQAQFSQGAPAYLSAATEPQSLPVILRASSHPFRMPSTIASQSLDSNSQNYGLSQRARRSCDLTSQPALHHRPDSTQCNTDPSVVGTISITQQPLYV